MNINCYSTSLPSGALHECRRGVTYKNKNMLKGIAKKIFFNMLPSKMLHSGAIFLWAPCSTSFGGCTEPTRRIGALWNLPAFFLPSFLSASNRKKIAQDKGKKEEKPKKGGFLASFWSPKMAPWNDPRAYVLAEVGAGKGRKGSKRQKER